MQAAIGLRVVQAGIPHFLERTVAVHELFGQLVGHLLRKIVNECKSGARWAAIVGFYDFPVIGGRRPWIGYAFVVPALNAVSNRIAGAILSLRGRLRRRNDQVHYAEGLGRRWRHESRLDPTN